MTSAFPDLLTPAQASAIVHVTSDTLARWSREGRIGAVRTLGGHRRYHASQIHILVDLRTLELEFPGVAFGVTAQGKATATFTGRIPDVTLLADPAEIRDAINAQIAEWSTP